MKQSLCSPCRWLSVSCICLSFSPSLSPSLLLLSLCAILSSFPSFFQENHSNGCNNVYIYVTIIKYRENYDRYHLKAWEQELAVQLRGRMLAYYAWSCGFDSWYTSYHMHIHMRVYTHINVSIQKLWEYNKLWYSTQMRQVKDSM